MTVWAISGVLAWTGARCDSTICPTLHIKLGTHHLTLPCSSFAELGSMIPLNGGAQAYLAYSYGPLISYLYTWTAISLLKPCSAAIISLIFGSVSSSTSPRTIIQTLVCREYLCRIMFHATQADALPNEIPDWAIKLTAFIAMLMVTLINVTSNRIGARTNVLLTILKVGCNRYSHVMPSIP